ncbi:dTDP-6-deoxy-3,4-keto-hexulose isomerase [Ureibacillus massiliensis 4400831 = CIP 108448 = CCUG 49529]|uniref:dTDP-6-deoxy-3,4-keto-hexulose isomerase n=1 Tax=Ureibacillus massiliensis 4400831 = CIP 108448 = CCUG 49529 TaxID=1211035 RepID=A0A0A3IZ39_9BACL|nr:FdtA/QdtA family cupin domain-containing protein [Ureibacillus massiliensis]KGR90039.1 dTDP-6-deoxy-3,4-keto-hexulose isomerase [Ureibacillus massiliensis 4400831 = CIP 108448 = CCUG 49529]
MSVKSQIIQINSLSDERGSLSVIESNKQIPFEIRRVFYIFSTKENIRRGFHAHYKTRQALVSVSGTCKVFLDNTIRKEEVILDSPNKVLILEPNDWHEMYDFSDDCVLLVLASEHYDSNDYIRDYDEFVSVYGNKQYLLL